MLDFDTPCAIIKKRQHLNSPIASPAITPLGQRFLHRIAPDTDSSYTAG